jgi:predicted nucleic acid-binding protein
VTYFDTSALIKRFVNEKGSALIRSIIERTQTVATAKIAYAEIFAGLTRKLRERHISRSEYDRTCRQFEDDWQA